MVVLVTGGGGYIGSHIALALTELGEKVVVIDNLSTGFSEAIRFPVINVFGDIGDEKLLSRVIEEHNVDAIIHCAASAIVSDSLKNPLDYYLNNTSHTRTLIDVAVRTAVSTFIFSSTAAVYAPNVPSPMDESAPTRPVSPYGRSKLMSELMLDDAANASGLKISILRYFNVAGADPRGRIGQSTKSATHLIKVASETALGLRECLPIFGTDYDTPDGTCIRDFIHVSDLADLHCRALLWLRSGGNRLVANCGYGAGYSVRQIVSSMERLSGTTIRTVDCPRRDGDLPVVVADASLAKNVLGWIPKRDLLDNIIADAFLWEKKRLLTNPR